ncbi:MAG: hypothetical protein HKP48_07830 [Winogradskyella sp.]|uniref:DUF6048 family protein n=1 Tax=Winogradskyella sp. TaxID=1883156 RepID=UPI0017BB11EE|nr:DUF6048 family protein [Winogradskyella sp.]MBT8244187.1 hypothetical protein [Winogradskyella sp.]NNK23190.1 hypothetical protein [Winogradskyella sp.]
MYKYFIKSIAVLLICTSSVFSQDEEQTTAADTTIVKQRYGLRLGADMSKLVRSFLDDDYQGFEINGDYRLTQRLYLAGELGNEERTLTNEALSSTAKGSYFKAGVDINLYRNWLDMENMIFAGFRVGASTFSQTLNSYTIYDINNQYFGEQVTIDASEEFDGLTAIWGEFIFGIKAEVLTNLYMGLNLQLKFLASETSPTNFENLYIPGFNRTYDSGIIGAGFGYNISYLIPIYKKAKKKKVKEVEEDNTEDN